MIQRLGRRKYKVFAMDVESHNDEESIAKNETSIWLGCFLDEHSEVEDSNSYFYDIETFIARLEEESRPRYTKDKTRLCKNVCVFIYNLSFEWSFILPELKARGFSFSPSIEKEDSYVFNSVSTISCSSVWQVEMKFGKNSGKVLLRDLAKIFGGGLGKVAKSFNLETQKGSIDYRLNRLHGHIVTKEEKEYCFKDTRIIVEILEKMKERGDRDFWNSISMATYSMRKLIRYGWPRKTKPYKEFREKYPVLSQEENDFLRKGVGGGVTYAPERWQFKIVDQKIGHIDLHQAHPSSAYYKNFPCGKGEYFTGKPPLGKICCCRIRISYDFVRLHSVISLIGLPFISGKEITVWDFEIPTMRKCYGNLRIEFIDGYAYKIAVLPWRRYYAHNYNQRLEAKKAKDDFNILFYKLLNNSSYGKFLEKPHNSHFENTINAEGIITSIEHPKDEEERTTGGKYTYVPVGSCIPAYTRVTLVEAAFKLGWENVLYFDTDSIFFIWNEQTAKAWSSFDQRDFLGGWGWEEFIDRAQFTAPKRYKTETDGKTTIKAGGINFAKYKQDHGIAPTADIPFDEVNIVSSKWEVQRAYRCKGGTLIKFQRKEMNVQKKYLDVYNKNAGKVAS